ncbi:proline-rich protein 2-like [Phyllostomus discolor]|uniref:Proline-rich protein 2-like n=1 Tax=Phyllostomus discolor TaxID=89673 RepID=A0A7E6E4K4_9CHIR|nr:proline-rich protein 2-like [Phyllostomus discolor]
MTRSRFSEGDPPHGAPGTALSNTGGLRVSSPLFGRPPPPRIPDPSGAESLRDVAAGGQGEPERGSSPGPGPWSSWQPRAELESDLPGQEEAPGGEGGEGKRLTAPAGPQGRRQGVGTGDTVSGGAETVRAGGAAGPPRAERALREGEAGDEKGLPNPQDDKRWCCPAHAWALDPGLLQVPLALTQEYAAHRTTTPPHSGIGSRRFRRRTEIAPSTTGREPLPRQHPPRRRRPRRRWRPPPARPHHHRPPSPPPPFPTFLSSSLVSSFSLLSFAQRARAPGAPFPLPPNSICTISRLHWLGPRTRPCTPERVRDTTAERARPLRPGPPPRAPATHPRGRPGAVECVGPCPPPAWSGSSEHREHLQHCAGHLACVPPHRGFTRGPGLINKFRYSTPGLRSFLGGSSDTGTGWGT